METQVTDKLANAAQQAEIQFLLLLLLTEVVEVDLVDRRRGAGVPQHRLRVRFCAHRG
jgi:hypothetical protein